MADTPPRTGTPAPPGPTGSPDTDLLVIGGGPAGCAAVRMAASVGMRSVLVEPRALCHTLHRIPALDNVLGGHTGGPRLAEAVAAEVAGTDLCHLLLGHRVSALHVTGDHVTATLDTGARLSAPYAVVATGVGPRRPRDTAWVTAPDGPVPPPLWEADAARAEGRTLLVLGGDRPIGTFLRAHPAARTRLVVAYPAADAYKTEEIREDPRVTLLPVEHLTVRGGAGAPVAAEAVGRDGVRHTVTADAVYLSLGSAPAAPSGDLVRDGDGYCPPEAQHPRVLVAGDLRSARYQRIMTAFGSGGEAALRAYYGTPHGPR